MIVGRIVGQQHLGHAADLRGGVGDGAAPVAGDQDMHIAAGRLSAISRAAATACRVAGFSALVVVFGNDEDGHQITRASFFSLSTSSADRADLDPARRFAGSSTFKVTSRGVTSTPSSSGVIVTIGFFFAFMMFGSEA